MKIANSPGGRGPQLLKLLIEHGPLSSRGLASIVTPTISGRAMRAALLRLYKRGLVVKRNEKIFRGSAVFYEITRDKDKWIDIAKLAQVNVGMFESSLARPAERIHSEICAVWIEKLKGMFPGASFIRDYAIRSSDLAKSFLASEDDERDSLPDFLMLMQGSNSEQLIAIAFEVERFAKSSKRIVKKLKKYAAESLLDGVIYINDDASISKKLIKLYNSRVRKDADRINNYGANFLLCNDSTNLPVDNSICVTNCDAKNVDMSDWVNKISQINLEKRFDHNF